jgi:hypothetical protein
MNIIKHIYRPALTAADEVAFGLLSKNDWIKKEIKKYNDKHPNISTGVKVVGNLASGALPGGVGVKVLSKIGRLGKTLQGAGMASAAARGAVYGGAHATARGAAKGDKVSAIAADTAQGALGGAVAGAALEKIPSAIRIMRGIRKPKITKGRETISEIAGKMKDQLDSHTIKHAKNLATKPTKNSVLEIDNLITNPTQASERMADSLYQVSPKAAKVVDRMKDKIATGEKDFLEKEIANVSGGSRPSVENWTALKDKEIEKLAEKLYNEAYTNTNINLPDRVKGSQVFKTELKKALKSINDVDKNDPTFSQNSTRILDRVKRALSDEYNRLDAKGLTTERNELAGDLKRLTETLKEQNPKFKEAVEKAGEGIRIRKTAAEGAKFSKEDIPSVKKALSEMTGVEKEGYTVGAMEKLLKNLEAKAKTNDFAELGKEITNPEVSKYLRLVLGKDKAEQLINNTEKLNTAVKTIKGIKGGSPTNKRNYGTRFWVDVFGTARGKLRSISNMITRAVNVGNKLTADRTAKSQMNLLANPERFIKYLPENRLPAGMVKREKIFKTDLAPIIAGHIGVPRRKEE